MSDDLDGLRNRARAAGVDVPNVLTLDDLRGPFSTDQINIAISDLERTDGILWSAAQARMILRWSRDRITELEEKLTLADILIRANTKVGADD